MVIHYEVNKETKQHEGRKREYQTSDCYQQGYDNANCTNANETTNEGDEIRRVIEIQVAIV